jgi:hypothetical protein
MQNSDKSYFVLMQRETKLGNVLKNSLQAMTVPLRTGIQLLMTEVCLHENTSKKGGAKTDACTSELSVASYVV